MQIAENTVVHINYTLTDDAGEVLDSSQGRAPLAYLHGAGNIVAGLEEALSGKQPGDELQVSLPPEKGYGTKDAGLVQDVPRSAFQGVEQIEPGMQFRAESQSGTRVITVVDVGDEAVKVDANHPLAGKTLNFDVSVVDVRPATTEEVDHGHPHGPGGAHE